MTTKEYASLAPLTIKQLTTLVDRFPKFLLTLCLAISAPCVLAAHQKLDCSPTTVWEQSGEDEIQLLNVTRTEGDPLQKYPPPKDPKNTWWYKIGYNQSHTAYFLDPGLKYAQLLVVTQKKKGVKLDVVGWEYRPLTAKWLTNNLLKIEMSFNPHAGIYWVFDIRTNRVVSSRHFTEDPDLIAKCNVGE